MPSKSFVQCLQKTIRKLLAGAILTVFAPDLGAVTVINNLDQPFAGNAALQSSQILAAPFSTSEAGWEFQSFTLRFSESTGEPPLSTLTVSIHSDNAGKPGALLQTLLGDPNPISAGLYQYTSPVNVALNPNDLYWILFQVDTPNTTYLGAMTLSSNMDTLPGWTMNTSWLSPNGVDWINAGSYFLTSIEAIPESASGSILLASGATLLFFKRRKNRRS